MEIDYRGSGEETGLIENRSFAAWTPSFRVGWRPTETEITGVMITQL